MKLAVLYAGQGAQHPGMGKEFYEASSAFRAAFDAADLPFDLHRVCFDDPDGVLNQTEYTQPCMVAFACGVSAVLAEQGVKPAYVAGLSLGEYSALEAAGVFTAKQAIELAAYRGKAMADAASGIDCGMTAVLNLDRVPLAECCEQASALGCVQICNYNCPGQLVIGGEKAAVDKAAELAKQAGVSRASVLRASHYTRGIDIADNLSPGIKQKVFSGEVKFTNEEMSKLVQASVEHRSDVLAQILHPEALEVLESASAEFEPEKAEPVPMPTPQTEEFRCYHVPDEFMKVYKSLSRATEMMKNSWKKTLKNNPSYFTDPEKQKVLRFAMQRPANYLTEIETYLEKALAEALEGEKTA